MHAATYAREYSGNPLLKQKIDSLSKVLIAAQEPDGYLGTYLDKDRWTDWDVWSHKYNIIGLLTYYKATGYEPALEACKKTGNLLINTFQNGNKDMC
ncbi:MAG: glycoside hydrolase family 127 protein [Bacteroidota bacterium]|nr:glycoside hydrolase family 127 protein [Bacteroidota bacterium]